MVSIYCTSMKIKLLKPHRHAGVNYQAGEVLDVDTDTSNYLAEAKVAKPIGESTPTPTIAATVVSQEVQPVTTSGRGKPSEPRVEAKAVSKVESVPTVDPVGRNEPTGNTPEIA